MSKFDLIYTFNDEQICKLKEIFYKPISNDKINELSELKIVVNDTIFQDELLPIKGGLNDPRLGDLYYGNKLIIRCGKCEKIQNKNSACKGHFGYILLENPVIHPFFYNKAIDILSNNCSFCGEENFNKYSKDKKGHIKRDKSIISLREVIKLKNTMMEFDSNNKTVEYLDSLFIWKLLVIPNNMRELYIDNGKLQNEITKKLQHIMYVNNDLRDSIKYNAPDNIIDNIIYDLQFAVNSYFRSIDYRINKSLTNKKDIDINRNPNLKFYSDFLKYNFDKETSEMTNYIYLKSGPHQIQRITRRILENRQYHNSSYTLIEMDNEKNNYFKLYTLVKQKEKGVKTYLIQITNYDGKRHYNMWEILNELKSIEDAVKHSNNLVKLIRDKIKTNM